MKIEGLSGKEKAAFGFGAVGKDLVYMLTASFILYYYQDVLGISAVFTGMLLLVARVFDALNDPVMGVLVARTRTKFGKFRPWILSGTILNALILYAMFSVPKELSGTKLLVYVSAAYIVWGVTYTMMDIPFWSMIPAFTKDGKERENMSALGRTCASMGSAIITVVTVKAVELLGNGNERVGFRYFALIIAVIFAISAVIMCFTIKEKSTVDMETISVGDMFRALLKNDQAMAVVVAIVILNCAVYLTSNLVIYFFKYDIGGANWRDNYTLFTTFGGAIQILAMMVLYPLMRKKLSTPQVFKFGVWMEIFGYIVLLVLSCTNKTNLGFLLIPGFLIFAANGVLIVLTTVFLANTVDYGEWKNGRRDESVIFSMQTFVVKLASGVSALLASVCLELFHISDNTEAATTVGNSSVMGLRFFMTIIPMVGLVFGLVYFGKKFILDENKVQEIADYLQGEKNDYSKG